MRASAPSPSSYRRRRALVFVRRVVCTNFMLDASETLKTLAAGEAPTSRLRTLGPQAAEARRGALACLLHGRALRDVRTVQGWALRVPVAKPTRECLEWVWACCRRGGNRSPHLSCLC